jgi:hypothetical protein
MLGTKIISTHRTRLKIEKPKGAMVGLAVFGQKPGEVGDYSIGTDGDQDFS